ncbi:MAG: hypothetical protein MRY83_05420 [Flavobacteriales bacterium]|nr:hypothetical protein [Flavobacteriales bacterium]
MKRRSFIKKVGLTAAASTVVPYILPSGRLFAETGAKLVDHVVYVLFAGGLRQQESILQRYLDDSQPSETTPGNIMYNLLNGAAPANKIAYGTGQGGINPIPQVLAQTLESQGTTFREMNALSRGHYGGLNNLLQGSTAASQGLKKKPLNPTIFEYLRRHGGYKATDVWFIGNGIGNSIPLLNYSEHPEYGAKYGANFFAPNITFGEDGQKWLADAKVYHPEDELEPIDQMKLFLDNSFKNYGVALDSLGNTFEEKQNIKAFMEEMFFKTQGNAISHPPVAEGGDSRTIGYACELMKWFKPALTVVNLSGVDSCHSSFTGYIKALHRADHAVGYMWDFIQSQIPEMTGNTAIVIAPECGRNLDPNPIIDENNWVSYDHSDNNSLRVFGMMAGPNIPNSLSIGSESNPIGQITDCVPTIGELLGVKAPITSSGFLASGTMSLFDRI